MSFYYPTVNADISTSYPSCWTLLWVILNPDLIKTLSSSSSRPKMVQTGQTYSPSPKGNNDKQNFVLITLLKSRIYICIYTHLLHLCLPFRFKSAITPIISLPGIIVLLDFLYKYSEGENQFRIVNTWIWYRMLVLPLH